MADYNSQRVVIVDDNEDIRNLLHVRFGLTNDLNVIGEASDGELALIMIQELKPDSIVLDLTMPIMDGEAALPLIRKVSPTTKIVVYSASAPKEISNLPEAVRADAYVHKGQPLTDLISTLRNFGIRNYDSGALT